MFSGGSTGVAWGPKKSRATPQATPNENINFLLPGMNRRSCSCCRWQHCESALAALSPTPSAKPIAYTMLCSEPIPFGF